MAVIGSYAGVVFQINNKKKLTFNDFTREISPRWEMHDLLLNKPIPEFKGPGTDTISFSIKLRADLGVNPEKEMKKLRDFANKGKTSLFVRGKNPISTNHWVIKSLKEEHKVIDNKGNVLSIDAELTLIEYPKNKVKPKKKAPKSKKKSSDSKSKTKKAIGKITITVKSVHIRAGRGTTYKVLGYAFRGDTLTVYDEKNGWHSLGGGKYITANRLYSKFKKG